MDTLENMDPGKYGRPGKCGRLLEVSIWFQFNSIELNPGKYGNMDTLENMDPGKPGHPGKYGRLLKVPN